ncbi:MAG: tyrosine-type recombinase/integrase [Methyloceanibacter sp.]
MAKKLTQISLEKIRPDPARRLEIPDAGKPGLYLVVQPSGRRSWAVRYRLPDGRTRKLTLIGLPSLPVARALAQEALDKVAQGGDPAREKKISRHKSEDLFRDVAAQFLERHVKPNCRRSYARETERLLAKNVLPLWGDRRIHEIERRDVLDLLDDVVDRIKQGGERGLTANRVLAAIRKLFSWAIQRGIVAASPVAGVTPPVAEKARDRILTGDEILQFWKATTELGYPFGDLAKMLLLTGQRRNEVAQMTWGELDLDRALWTLPGERTKNRKPHEVPLSDAAMGIIAAMPRIQTAGGFVFTSNGRTRIANFSRGKTALDSAMHGENHWTLHDLRRTAASGMARLGIALPVIEKALNHSSGSFRGIVSVYQRHSYADEKRNALQAWARFVLSLNQPAGNVSGCRRGHDNG